VEKRRAERQPPYDEDVAPPRARAGLCRCGRARKCCDDDDSSPVNYDGGEHNGGDGNDDHGGSRIEHDGGEHNGGDGNDDHGGSRIEHDRRH
jgi:hypothetical protein